MSSAGVERRGSAATVRACDSCRRRKRRCVWAAGAASCTHCVQLKEECNSTHVRKQRAKPQKRDRITDYEHRIKKLENLLKDRSEAQPRVQQQPLQPADLNVPLSTWVDNLRTEFNSFPDDVPDINPDSYDGPIEIYATDPPTGSSGNSDLVASGSDDPLLTSLDSFEPSTDFQEEANLLQDPSFQPTVSLDDLTIGDTEPAQAQTKCSNSLLPPPELGASLLREFLNDFNTAFPLFRPYAIAEHLRVCYEGGSDGTALAWAAAYVVLGIAHRTRGMSAVGTPQDNQMADWYFYRILPTVSGLLVATPSLGLVQCLLGLSLLMKSSSLSTPYASFVPTALRIAQSLEYEVDPNIDSEHIDLEQRRRVFWLTFVTDTDENMLSNTPRSQRREDIITDFPDPDPEDSLGAIKAAEGNWKVNLFALRIRLVQIQADAIEQVLSIKPRKSTPQDTITAVQKLLGRLQIWRKNELFRMNASQLMQLLYRSDLLQVLSVEASYFATVFRLHAFVVLGLNTRINPFGTEALTRLAGQTKHTAYKDAERLLSVLSQTPHDDIGICWMVKLPIVAALTTLLAHYLHHPDEAPPPDGMREYMRILRTLGVLVQQSKDLELQRARELCMMLYTKVETGLRIKWLHGVVDTAEETRLSVAQAASVTKP